MKALYRKLWDVLDAAAGESGGRQFLAASHWLMRRVVGAPPPEVEQALRWAVGRNTGTLESMLLHLTVRPADDDFRRWLYRFVRSLDNDAWCSVRTLQLLLHLGCTEEHEEGGQSLVELACDHSATLRGSGGLLSAALARGLLELTHLFAEEVQLHHKEQIAECCESKRFTLSDRFFAQSDSILSLLPRALSRDRDFLVRVGKTVSQVDGHAGFRLLPVELRGDRDVAEAFVSGGADFGDAPDHLHQDRELVEVLLRRRKVDIRRVRGALQTDLEILKAAAHAYGGSFFDHTRRRSAAESAYSDHQALACAALSGDRWRGVLPRLSARLRSTAAVALMGFRTTAAEAAPGSAFCGAGCCNDGDDALAAWESVGASLKRDPDFLQRLVSLDGAHFRLLPQERRSRRLAALAVKTCPAALDVPAPDLWSDDGGLGDFCVELLRANRECWMHMPRAAKESSGLDWFECPVCHGLPAAEVRQCKNGHTVCADCARKLADKHTCPTCRCQVPESPYGSRCLFAERMLEVELSGRAQKRARQLEQHKHAASNMAAPRGVESVLALADVMGVGALCELIMGFVCRGRIEEDALICDYPDDNYSDGSLTTVIHKLKAVQNDDGTWTPTAPLIRRLRFNEIFVFGYWRIGRKIYVPGERLMHPLRDRMEDDAEVSDEEVQDWEDNEECIANVGEIKTTAYSIHERKWYETSLAFVNKRIGSVLQPRTLQCRLFSSVAYGGDLSGSTFAVERVSGWSQHHPSERPSTIAL